MPAAESPPFHLIRHTAPPRRGWCRRAHGSAGPASPFASVVLHSPASVPPRVVSVLPESVAAPGFAAGPPRRGSAVPGEPAPPQSSPCPASSAPGARLENVLPSTTVVPVSGTDSIWNLSISRRTPMIPSPIPVADRYRPSRMLWRSLIPGPRSRKHTSNVLRGCRLRC